MELRKSKVTSEQPKLLHTVATLSDFERIVLMRQRYIGEEAYGVMQQFCCDVKSDMDFCRKAAVRHQQVSKIGLVSRSDLETI